MLVQLGTLVVNLSGVSVGVHLHIRWPTLSEHLQAKTEPHCRMDSVSRYQVPLE